MRSFKKITYLVNLLIDCTQKSLKFSTVNLHQVKKFRHENIRKLFISLCVQCSKNCMKIDCLELSIGLVHSDYQCWDRWFNVSIHSTSHHPLTVSFLRVTSMSNFNTARKFHYTVLIPWSMKVQFYGQKKFDVFSRITAGVSC